LEAAVDLLAAMPSRIVASVARFAPVTVVLMGASLHIASCPVLRALFALYKARLLSEHTVVLAISDSTVDDSQFRQLVRAAIHQEDTTRPGDDPALLRFSDKVQHVPVDKSAFTRLVFEPPHGLDMDSAVSLNKQLHASVDEEQVFRIACRLSRRGMETLLGLRHPQAYSTRYGIVASLTTCR
jgi:glucose-6-phosphate 1-dehydrogenase